MRQTVTTYEPDYGFGFRLMPIIFAFMSFAVIGGAVELGSRNPIFYPLGLFSLIFLFLPFQIIKRVRFEDQMIVERFFIAPYKVSYTDITDVGIKGFKTRKRSFSLGTAKNAQDFHAILAYVMQNRNINKEQLEGELAQQELMTSRTLLISGLLAWPFSIVVNATVTVPWPRELTSVFAFLPISLVVWSTVKRRSSKERN